VNAKKIDFAIVTKKFDTFDTVQKKLGEIQQVVVASNNVDASNLKTKGKNIDYEGVENWFNQQKWFNHDAGIPHIKLFWLHVFNKKRPSIIPNYIIPSEYEMLDVLSKNTGVAVSWDINAKSFIQQEKLQLLWKSKEMPATLVYLLSGKNGKFNSPAQEIEDTLKELWC
jgi:hypothetical protein